MIGSLESSKPAWRKAAEKREEIIALWFQMWLRGEDLGIREIFDPDCVYTESWGPQYRGAEQVARWFREWNTRGRVTDWEIKQFFHRRTETAVEWYFRNAMKDGKEEAFDGMTLICWTQEGKIASLKEFGCNLNRYDPYAQGEQPRFREEAPRWF